MELPEYTHPTERDFEEDDGEKNVRIRLKSANLAWDKAVDIKELNKKIVESESVIICPSAGMHSLVFVALIGTISSCPCLNI